MSISVARAFPIFHPRASPLPHLTLDHRRVTAAGTCHFLTPQYILCLGDFDSYNKLNSEVVISAKNSSFSLFEKYSLGSEITDGNFVLA
jgi:hypothetical protein